ncbi:MAG TPA: GUN4 domain-containing protein, partial [Oculatellaceae cyanobacterium]
MVEPNGSSSVNNTDCSKLQELLKAGQWEEADKETLAIMLRATNREQEGWLDLEHIKQIPDSELSTINRLWLNYSNGHFGFSVQKSLLQKVFNKSLFWFLWEVGWLKTLSWADGS